MNDLLDPEVPPMPAMGAELSAELDGLAVVPTRRPWLDVVRIATVSAAYAAALLFTLTVRGDLSALPMPWVFGYGAAWLLGFIALLWLALVPRRGWMLPRWQAVGGAAIAAAVGFVALGLVLHRGSGGDSLGGSHACVELGVLAAAVPVLLGTLALRGAVPVGSRWVAAGLGAAGGSLGGLVLHLHCPLSGPWHLALAHGGVVVIGAAIAALLVPRRLVP